MQQLVLAPREKSFSNKFTKWRTNFLFLTSLNTFYFFRSCRETNYFFPKKSKNPPPPEYQMASPLFLKLYVRGFLEMLNFPIIWTQKVCFFKFLSYVTIYNICIAMPVEKIWFELPFEFDISLI